MQTQKSRAGGWFGDYPRRGIEMNAMSLPRQTLGTPGSHPGTPGSPSNPTGSPHGSPSQADPPASYPISRYASGDQNTDQSFVGHRYSDIQKQMKPSPKGGLEFRLSAQEEEGIGKGDIDALFSVAKRAASVIAQAHHANKVAQVPPFAALLGAWHEHIEAKTAHRRESHLWTFCRTLKGCATFADMSPSQAATAVHQLLSAIPSNASSVWVNWLGVQEGECGFTELATTWKRVQWANGNGPLIAAARLADEQPPALPDVPLTIDTPLYRRFLGMVHHLHKSSGKPVPLPCREVGRALGVGRSTVCRLRQLGVMDGLLMMTRPHKMGTGGRSGDATEYVPVDPTQPPATTNYYDDPKA